MPTGDGVLDSAIYRLGPIPIQIVGLEVGRGGWHEDLDTGVGVEQLTVWFGLSPRGLECVPP